MTELIPKYGLTPTSKEGVSKFYKGLCAIVETIEFSAPAEAAIAITPSLFALLKELHGHDELFYKVEGNLKVIDYRTMKKEGVNRYE